MENMFVDNTFYSFTPFCAQVSVQHTFYREHILSRTHSIDKIFYGEHILWRTHSIENMDTTTNASVRYKYSLYRKLKKNYLVNNFLPCNKRKCAFVCVGDCVLYRMCSL